VLVVVLVLATVGVSYEVHRINRPSFGSKVAGRSGTGGPTTSGPPAAPVCQPAPALSWQPAGPSIGGQQPLQESVQGPSEGAVWMDTSRLRLQLIPGKQVPGGTAWKTIGDVPIGDRTPLVAAFSGGQALTTAHGGFYAEGRVAGQLTNGAASLVIGTDGQPDIRAWDQGPTPRPEVAAVRQQLVLMVDGGSPTPDAASKPLSYWGATTTGWRSGAGVDNCHNLIWAGGANLTPAALAALLVRAGAVRAMELQVTHSQVTFNTYLTSLGSHGTKLLTAMNSRADRYLTPDMWDFVAVLRR
jgi:hypothetical protein